MKQAITVEFSSLEWLYSQDWVYFDDGECKRRLQLILPYSRAGLEKKVPVIFYIPGAAWHRQEMYNDMPKLCKLAEKGFAVAAVEVRESDIAVFPAQLEDIRRAMAFIGEKVKEQALPFDMDAAFLMGNSSGGHLAMMAALFSAHGRLALPPVQGVILESAASDILLCAKDPLPPWMKVRPTAVLLGVDSIEGNEELARSASCVPYVTREAEIPPVLMLHAENDPIVSVENSRTLYSRLTETGHQADYYELKQCAEHGGNAFFSEAILSLIQQFIQRRL